MASSFIEAKVIAKLRARLLATSGVTAVVGQRVSDAHPSQVSEPVFPAVTLFLLPSVPLDMAQDGGIVLTRVQVDTWIQGDSQAKSVVYDVMHAIRGALHRYSAKDSDVLIVSVVEEQGGAVQFEQDTRLWHGAQRFAVIAS